MALVLANRVQESATANTTVSFTLTGAILGFQTFSVIGNGNTTYYSAADTVGNWEVGIGTYSTTGPTLTRDIVYASSNSNTPVTFPGLVSVFVTYPSGRSVNLDASGNVSALGTVSSGTWQGSTVGVAYGGTGVTSSSGANSVVLRDSNANITVNRINQGLQTITASGGTTTLTAASEFNQALVGTGGHTFRLPDATTLSDTTAFQFNNNATGTLTIENNAGTPIGTIAAGGAAGIALLNNATVGGTWDVHAYIPENVTWGTNALNLGATVISGGTWQGGTVQPAYGGTGLTSFVGANNALYSTGATTLTAGTLPVTAGGTGQTTYTDGQLLIGNSTGNTLTKATLTAGGGICISVGPGSITIGSSIGFATKCTPGLVYGITDCAIAGTKTALGYMACTLNDGVAVGVSSVGGNDSVAVGYTANASNNAIAVGFAALAGSCSSIAIGKNASVGACCIPAVNSIAIGPATVAAGSCRTHIGPIRSASSIYSLYYSPCSREVTYDTAPAPASATPTVEGIVYGRTESCGTTRTALGSAAGSVCQGQSSVAIGYNAATSVQGAYSVAVGPNAGGLYQAANSVAIGNGAGNGFQGTYSVAIGSNAGNYVQGSYSIAIGYSAGASFQHGNTTVINATGSTLNSAGSSRTYVAPIRCVCSTAGLKTLYYDTTSKEVTSGALAALSADVQEFTATGTSTWTKPNGAKLVYVLAFSGGGGGGGGSKHTGSTGYFRGGVGGSAGSRVEGWFPASLFGATETVIVGAGGTGGAGATSAGGNGGNGNAGSASSFSTLIYAQPPGAASGGSFTSSVAQTNTLPSSVLIATFVAGSSSLPAALNAGQGGGNSSAQQPPPAYRGGLGGGGGGGGGGTVTGGGYAGGIGGLGGAAISSSNIASYTGGGGSSGAINSNGGAGAASIGYFVGGSGGGGGGAGTITNGGNGGTGGYPGGGGGGGGGSNPSSNGGNGGNGADGYVRVVTFF